MEANLMVRFACESPELRTKIMQFLTEDGRPVFEDEVERKYRKLFRALEYTEIPKEMYLFDETGVHAYFFLGDNYEEDMVDLLKDLLKAGVQRLLAYVESGDDIQFAYVHAGKLKTLPKKQWSKKRVTAANNDLQKSFAYLNELSATLYPDDAPSTRTSSR